MILTWFLSVVLHAITSFIINMSTFCPRIYCLLKTTHYLHLCVKRFAIKSVNRSYVPWSANIKRLGDYIFRYGFKFRRIYSFRCKDYKDYLYWSINIFACGAIYVKSIQNLFTNSQNVFYKLLSPSNLENQIYDKVIRTRNLENTRQYIIQLFNIHIKYLKFLFHLL